MKMPVIHRLPLSRCLFLPAFLLTMLVAFRADAAVEDIVHDLSAKGAGGLAEARRLAERYAAGNGDDLGYHSTRVNDFQTFRGKYTPPKLPAEMQGRFLYSLALFSDDGCSVTIDGREVHNRYKIGQALPKLNQSFYELPVLLEPGKPVNLEINYSNVYYTTDRYPDIDGVTLFLHVVPFEMVPDYNRDGRIDDADRGQVTEINPWRWWVNDDDDSGEELDTSMLKWSGGDTPGQRSPDCRDDKIDGIRDLVDFFPLHMNLEGVTDLLPTSDYTYQLKQKGGGMRFREFPDAEVSAPDGASSWWKDLSQAKALGRATLAKASDKGSKLSPEMVQAFAKGRGLLICEASSANSEPLYLEVLDGKGQKVLQVSFPVRFSPVESMFRHCNMRNQTGGSGGAASRLSDPGMPYPDELTNGKYFAFVHGYNVDGEAARGWHAELFKRFHQMGSRARFIGISWHGDTGTDYHLAVKHAFLTSEKLAQWLKVPGELTIAGHSLGNMVVSNAIEHEGLNPKRYFMINAATPIEAYDIYQTRGEDRALMVGGMTHVGWKNYLPNRRKLFASDWHQLFSAKDGRSQLTWKGRFGSKVPKLAYNFYSTGEDVVKNPRENETTALHGVSAVVKWDAQSYAWVAQEIAKGNATMRRVLKDTHAGWRFNEAYLDSVTHAGRNAGAQPKPMKPSEAAQLSEEIVRKVPFHQPFKYKELYQEDKGSACAAQKIVQYELLASAIPAMSYAVAANAIRVLDKNGQRLNYDMMNEKANGWPRAEPDWKHSDFRNVALTYVRPVYEKMMQIGKLNE